MHLLVPEPSVFNTAFRMVLRQQVFGLQHNLGRQTLIMDRQILQLCHKLRHPAERQLLHSCPRFHLFHQQALDQ